MLECLYAKIIMKDLKIIIEDEDELPWFSECFNARESFDKVFPTVENRCRIFAQIDQMFYYWPILWKALGKVSYRTQKQSPILMMNRLS